MTSLLDHSARPALDGGAADLIFREARTAYRFTDQPVTADDRAVIHDLLRFPPTAVNSQPLRVLWVVSAEARAQLLPHVAEGNRAKVESAPATAVLAADMDFHQTLARVAPHAPGLADRFADPVRREETARFNATLQAGYFILAVRAAGLAAGPMGGFDAAGVDSALLGGTSWRSFLLVNVGHAAPDGHWPRAPRLAEDEVVIVR